MTGLFYDQFHIGQTFKHSIRRTVTEADNVFLHGADPQSGRTALGSVEAM